MKRPTRHPGSAILLTAGVLLFTPGDAFARTEQAQLPIISPADTLEIDLELALSLALERSWRIERERLDLKRDTYNLEASRAALRAINAPQKPARDSRGAFLIHFLPSCQLSSANQMPINANPITKEPWLVTQISMPSGKTASHGYFFVFRKE